MNRSCHAGFTLVEIMLAVAILAILTVLAIPAYEGFIRESRYGTAVQDMQQMRLILDDLAGDNDLIALDNDNTGIRGVYMAGDGAIVIDDPSSTPAGTSPWQDPWGNTYRYQRPDNTVQVYNLWSFGPDGANANGTGDDAVPN